MYSTPPYGKEGIYMDTPYLLYIDAAVRPQSRTRQLCSRYLSVFAQLHPNVQIRRRTLADMQLSPKTAAALERIDALLAQGRTESECFEYAREFAQADRILIGAPYWDFSFPALLKLYIENICMSGITFTYENDRPKGLCRALRLVYITTAGGSTAGFDLGSEYVCKLCSGLLGISRCRTLAIDMLDIIGTDTAALMENGFLAAERLAHEEQ